MPVYRSPARVASVDVNSAMTLTANATMAMYFIGHLTFCVRAARRLREALFGHRRIARWRNQRALCDHHQWWQSCDGFDDSELQLLVSNNHNPN
jgi:hypothetical protein